MPLKSYKEKISYPSGILLLTGLNFLGGKSVFIFAYVENDITLLWPPIAIGLAFLLRFGLKYWPGVLLGEFFIHYSNGQSAFLASTTGLAEVISIGVTIFLLRKVGFSKRFTRQQDVLYFTLFGLLVCPVTEASLGVSARLLDGMVSLEEYGQVWISWVVGDVTALIVLFPVLVTWPNHKVFAHCSLLKFLEFLCLLMGLSLASYFVFLYPTEASSNQIPLVYLPMAFLIWAALRFGPYQTALAGLITSGMAVVGTARGFSPFIQENVFSTIAFLWAYLIVASVLALLLAVIQVENQQAHEKVQNSEARFKALSSAGFEAIFVSMNGVVVDLNEAALELFGYDYPQLNGMPLRQLIASDSVEMFEQHMASNEQNPFELKALRKDGGFFFAECRYRVYQYEENKVVILALRDVTSLKKALEKEQHLNEELAIHEEELRQQLLFVEKMNIELEKTNKALDRFVYSASHDLRAPISSALGLITIARMEEDRNELINYLDMQEKSLHRLDQFIGDILNYSRNSRTDILKEKIQFSELVQEIFKNYEFAKNFAKIKKIIKIEQAGLFFSDQRRISIILNNLIANAIQYYNPYATEPYVKVQIETNWSEAIIKIIDNGVGIGAEHLDKVFDMFYRASTTNVGSGLGLYIVKEVVEKLNGTITLKSEIDKGTSFVLTIPNLI